MIYERKTAERLHDSESRRSEQFKILISSRERRKKKLKTVTHLDKKKKKPEYKLDLVTRRSDTKFLLRNLYQGKAPGLGYYVGKFRFELFDKKLPAGNN